MSVSSEELNYMIWRYMQEMGQELSALAMQEETRVLEFDQRYKEHIPIGQLVDLVQKGILYTESQLLTSNVEELEKSSFKERQEYFNEKFNLANALKINAQETPAIKSTGRFSLENESEEKITDEEVQQSLNETIYVKQNTNGDTNSVPSNGTPTVTTTVNETIVAPVSISGYNLPSINVGGMNGSSSIDEISQLYEFNTPIVTCEWHPTNPLLLCLGQEDSVAQLITFNETHDTVKITQELRHPFALSSTSGKSTNKVTCLTWSPDGQMVVTGVENGEIRLWNQEGQLQNVFNFHRCPVICMSWSLDSHHFVSMDVDNVAILWDVGSGTVLQHYELKSTVSGNPESIGVAIEWVDERRFVLPGIGGTIGVYETTESKPVGKLMGHQGVISCLTFHPTKKLLASASDDFTIRVWHGSNSNSTHCFYGHTQAITSLQWINDDLLISGSMDGSVRIWSVSENLMQGLLMLEGVPVFVGKLTHDRNRYMIGTMNGQIYVAGISEFIDNSRDSKNDLQLPLTIPVISRDGHQQTNNKGSVNDLSWSIDGHTIAAGYASGPGTLLTTPLSK
ncbi:similar to Saccharomyces cerevisiae YBR103W SIF2 WD40 repeat-containing subunit of the Set3C histone deacetylase complex, which represses early/middle sporulation genes [Maudiozyma saulgeensis]|uniref:Similar to Saccharomyces cerevisiae YBR103W SIF2 WD40 repeat-containing subunit of the Set3C histone deacetylase complex, which represses early/middle sporulation genes n=1 Tax=Maudiozyma saulgeensis TaxID=1789683 RepID=A0A1X7RBH7_9SACH|nr:similar to Saccharomyces cerevisiae YBR103W SIF2 WD40 repeat-containing subunit of the Set3C histone deacetylase complex, which represses early/middle sporulation genes [Kazachstania saulgeensis]